MADTNPADQIRQHAQAFARGEISVAQLAQACSSEIPVTALEIDLLDLVKRWGTAPTSGEDQQDLTRQVQRAADRVARGLRRRRRIGSFLQSSSPSVKAALDEADPLVVAKASFAWYARAAWRARVRSRCLEVALLVAGALVAVGPDVAAAPWLSSALGVVIVVLTGLRQVFGWNDDYLRFTQACGRLQTEVQRYVHKQRPGEGATREARAELADAVRDIEEAETRAWSRSRRPRHP